MEIETLEALRRVVERLFAYIQQLLETLRATLAYAEKLRTS